MNLKFLPPSESESGTIFSLLSVSYAELVSSDPFYWKPEEKKWKDFDHDIFQDLETIGKCVFLTQLESTTIGFGSFDLCQQPEFSIIGHNCILPRYQRNGYGKKD